MLKCALVPIFLTTVYVLAISTTEQQDMITPMERFSALKLSSLSPNRKEG